MPMIIPRHSKSTAGSSAFVFLRSVSLPAYRASFISPRRKNEISAGTRRAGMSTSQPQEWRRIRQQLILSLWAGDKSIIVRRTYF